MHGATRKTDLDRRAPPARAGATPSVSTQPLAPALARHLASATILLVLAGCGLFGTDEPDVPPPGCPPVHALIGADRVASYAAPGERIGDLRYVAAINQVRSRCRASGDGIELDVAFELVAERGPAMGPGPLQLRYFVATLAAPDDRVVGKRMFPIELTFGGRDLAGLSELTTLRLPWLDPDQPPTRRLVVGLEQAASPSAPQP